MSDMNLIEYQKQAITTKIYADEVALSYIALGLGGEAIELFEKIEENKNNICELTDDQLRLMSKEIGDVYWYLAGLAEEMNQELEDIVNGYRKALPNDVGFDEVVSTLVIKTGAILEVFKKALRDDYELFKTKVLVSDKEKKTNQAIADLVSCLEYLSNFFGVSVSTILQQNVDKLASRAKRGTLKGSGDER
jgi:NTP pyrophosphatase (non-canonical NTP hydrolase)